MKTLKTAVIPVILLLASCSSPELESGGTAFDERALSSSSNPNIATGGKHACLLFHAGKILCWGDNTYGQLGNGNTNQSYAPVLVNGITTAVAIAAGENHSCALLSDQTMRCWGKNGDGQLGNGATTNASLPVTVSGITTATAITTGGRHSCARLTNSTVKCWGHGLFGQLGNGSTASQSTPVSVTGITTATAITGGNVHSCARLSNSALKCWGDNGSGALGNGGSGVQSTPVSVTGITTATAVAAGTEHTCARLSNSTLKCWGRNNERQLGTGTTVSSGTPVSVTGISTATGIALGPYHSCARLSDGTAKCWGLNLDGQVGNGTTGASSNPVSVSGVTTAVELAAGGGFILDNHFTCALLSDGGVRCWGRNDGGQLGTGTANTQSVPFVVLSSSLNRVIDVAGGNTHTCVLWDTGSVKCWGTNSAGQLGNGTTTTSSTPVDVTGITAATAISAGYDHTCVRLSDSTLKCWGSNAFGQLGNGTTTNATSPVTVSGISSATTLGVGARHSCARLSDSTLQCWGRNTSGELGNGTTTQANTPVAVTGISDAISVGGGGDNTSGTGGSGHTCALSSTGAVTCWGKNTYGQLGNATTTDSKTAVSVSGLGSNVTGLALDSHSSCALLSDGTVKCWGRNQNGQLGDGTTTQRTTPVAVSGLSTAASIGAGVGGTHACATLTDKSVKCWGSNATGQLGTGNTVNSNVPVTSLGVTRAVKITGGASHTCTRRDDSTLMCWGSDTSGQIASGHKQSNPSPVAPPCRSVDFERSDYFVAITSANMPDPAFNGLAANIDVRRVKPLMFPETCSPTKALVFVHGRTIEAASAFDLQYQDYSILEQLALSGVDTFAMNQLGMGRSSGFTATSDACNASLPACLDIGQTCPPPNGVLCDCGPVPTFGVNDKNQQGTTRYLNPNPLSALCAHTTNTRFTNTTVMVADLDAVVDDALAKTGLSKVSLLGYSAGGVDVGNYLGEADNGIRAARTAKIERAIFVSSLFGLPQITDSEPNTGTTVHSFPMGLFDRVGATGGGFNLGEPTCPGQRDDGILDPIWSSLKARDSVGPTWGPTQVPSQNGGLIRFPHATRWGWNATAAARITVPVLVMQGLKDNVVPVAASSALYAALTGTTSKTIVQIGCASHSIFWEGCSGATCNGWTGPHATIRKNVGDWVNTGMIYASPGSENGSFGSTSEDGTNFHTDSPTSDGPTAGEENQLP